jgi:ribonuclease T1
MAQAGTRYNGVVASTEQRASPRRRPRPIAPLPAFMVVAFLLAGCFGLPGVEHAAGRQAEAAQAAALTTTPQSAPTPGSAVKVARTAKPKATRTPTATAKARATPTATALPATLDGLRVVSADQLPRQARETLALIDRGGPFPYRQDGAVFQNRERRLPRQPSGYYHEYTVKTPGSPDRGARRIVTGSRGEYYYTADHYETFVRVIRP